MPESAPKISSNKRANALDENPLSNIPNKKMRPSCTFNSGNSSSSPLDNSIQPDLISEHSSTAKSSEIISPKKISNVNIKNKPKPFFIEYSTGYMQVCRFINRCVSKVIPKVLLGNAQNKIYLKKGSFIF
ncbi:hypothetical protein AYI68_g7842 [Smittium mucronatum]|uniref:Uncharacterized protein n=1 Tax=Smittium mucronatum TaxID=133383 RepID=A0A1R0GMJ9_9FUNG|nr:hypothetical protein AYI68_g7842 [Smittium mucronatum]